MVNARGRKIERGGAAALAHGACRRYYGGEGRPARAHGPGRVRRAMKENAMNDIIRAMEERRSIRKFLGAMPPKDALEQIIEAGLYAASG
ncbi:MAG: nitroreductase family protein, partial [Mailhella sp.]|nr:nitroreductase family protein [Mailhella sp.]